MANSSRHSFRQRLNNRFNAYNVPDLLTAFRHTPDFLASRHNHVNDRTYTLALLFGVSFILWIPIDYVTVSKETFTTLMCMRLGFAASYFGMIAWRSRSHKMTIVRLRLFLLVLLPCVFYLACRSMLLGEASPLVQKVYNFFPFVIVVQLAVFPLTLLEGALLTLPVVAVMLISSDTLLASLWMLCLMSVLTCWAQLSQLHMLLRLYRQATRDPLTGLFNRRMLIEQLQNELLRAKRYRHPISIMIFDLDKFKRINDNYGHVAGDDVLRRFAVIVEDSLRTVDKVGRYGGEEFLAVLPETDEAGALEVAERIRSSCHNTMATAADGRKIAFTTSTGIAEYRVGEELNDLINRADQALYAVKVAGRDNVMVAGNAFDNRSTMHFA